MNCFPLLASVLGDKYGVEIRIGGLDARTDGNVIYLPAMPSDLDTETLENAKGYVDHESAHIRNTDFALVREANMDNVTKWLFNAIEDWRVENRLAAIFPGCRDNFRRLIRRIFVENVKEGAGNENPAFSILGYVLLAVRSWDVPEIKPRLQDRRQTIDSHTKGLPDELDKILEAVRTNCPDTQAAINYVHKLAECIRQWPFDDNTTGNENKSNDKSGLDNESKGKSKPDNPENSNSDSGHGDDLSSEENLEGDNEASGSNSGNQKSQTADGLKDSSAPDTSGVRAEEPQLQQQVEDMFSASMDELPRNMGEILAGKLEFENEENEIKGVVVASVGERIASPLPAEEIANAMRCCNSMRHRLCGLLQAQTLRQTGIGRKGKLHTGSLYRIATGNSRIFRQTSLQTGIDTAVHILLDCSSSMSGSAITIARDACYAVAKTLENIPRVNPAVTVFPAYLKDDSVHPLVAHGQRVGNNFGFSASGDTPLGPAVWWVMQRLIKLKEERKIVLIITDGVPNKIKVAEDAISQCLKLGFEVYGIGIQCECVKHFLSQCSIIYQLDELAPAMFEMLQNALFKGGVK